MGTERKKTERSSRGKTAEKGNGTESVSLETVPSSLPMRRVDSGLVSIFETKKEEGER